MIDVSICIVALNAREFLRGCLLSLQQNPSRRSTEIIIVDNGSTDGTSAMVQEAFPAVRLLKNAANEGFVRPMNRAMRAAQGQYVLLLNPDTVILPGLMDTLVDFLTQHPEVGICSPKVLNKDGTLQQACRRGESRPWAVFSYFLGLSRLFPHSRLFGEYLLNYLDENVAHEVAGVSGSCMLVRREVINQIGYFDERYFAYQEDSDYCLQARKTGWKIYYIPQAQVIHFGGQGGSRAEPYRSIIEWHRSYYLFYRKIYAAEYFFLFNWFYYLAMLVKLGVSLLANMFRREKHAGPKRG